MLRYYLVVCLALAAALCRAAVPGTLRVVDLRHITGQPELETWLGSLQGTLNRADGEAAVFLIRHDGDAAWADILVRMYHLKKEVLTPGALLEEAKPALTGQVRYDPAQPWTRNMALTIAAVSPQAVIAADSDLGLPTVLDLRDRWQDRMAAYALLAAQYGEKTDPSTCVLAPESGHQLADLIAYRKYLAVDLSPTDAAEAAAYKTLAGRYKTGSRVLGAADDRCGEPATAFWRLTALLRETGQVLVPVRNLANLSCFARFPVTRPLLQGRDESAVTETRNTLVLIYDGGDALLDGSQSLDYAAYRLLPLMEDPDLAQLPVGVEVPLALMNTAPAIYQALLARQRDSRVEFLAAPNGDGWALPMMMPEAGPYLQRTAAAARAMDLTGISLLDVGGREAYLQVLHGLAETGWRGAVARPVAPDSLPDKQPRQGGVMPGFLAMAAAARVRSISELRATLAKVEGQPFVALYLDPAGLPPGALRAVRAEIESKFTLITPSQAFRVGEEYAAVIPFLQAKQQQGIRNPKRDRPTLRVAAPTTTLAAPDAASPIPITVKIAGETPVLVARAIYTTPDGRLGVADLHAAGPGAWAGVLPPMLTGGTLTMRVRVVEQGGFGVSVSDPLVLTIPKRDTDRDSIDDTLEEYLGSDPAAQDSDGDGLPDPLDSYPVRYDREIQPLSCRLFAPADKPYLADAGASTVKGNERILPAGSTVVYRLPLQDLPAAQAVLSLETDGPGTVALQAGAPAPLDVDPDGVALTTVPLAPVLKGEATLTVRITAGAEPLCLLSLGLITNPDGPFFHSLEFSPAHPAAGVPFAVRAVVYDPKGVKAVRLRYGTAMNALKTLELTPVAGSLQTMFTAELPAQPGATQLIYGLEADNTAGSHSAGPYNLLPIGRTRRHSVSLIAERDFTGAWDPFTLGFSGGRSLAAGAGVDTHLLEVRPGTYTAWILAQPRGRGLAVTVVKQNMFLGDKLLLAREVPAGAPDGWFKLGTFTSNEDVLLQVSLTPRGDTGYVGYERLVFTQDDRYTPLLSRTSVDWYNTLTLQGISDGDTVSGRISVNVLSTGNIDNIAVTAMQTAGAVLTTKAFTFDKAADGRYTLDTRILPPGEYDIKAIGYKIASNETQTTPIALVTVTVHVTVKQR